jgi:hypothetical protein
LDSRQSLRPVTETTRFLRVWEAFQIAAHALRKRADLRVRPSPDISHELAYLYFSLSLNAYPSQPWSELRPP